MLFSSEYKFEELENITFFSIWNLVWRQPIIGGLITSYQISILIYFENNFFYLCILNANSLLLIAMQHWGIHVMFMFICFYNTINTCKQISLSAEPITSKNILRLSVRVFYDITVATRSSASFFHLEEGLTVLRIQY